VVSNYKLRVRFGFRVSCFKFRILNREQLVCRPAVYDNRQARRTGTGKQSVDSLFLQVVNLDGQI